MAEEKGKKINMVEYESAKKRAQVQKNSSLHIKREDRIYVCVAAGRLPFSVLCFALMEVC